MTSSVILRIGPITPIYLLLTGST